MKRHLVTGIWLTLMAVSQAAPIAWQAVRPVAGDADVATNGWVVKAYSFATGHAPTVNGVVFRDFRTQSTDTHNFGAGFDAFYSNPALSPSYNQLLAGALYDAGHLETPSPQRLTLRGLTRGRRYLIQIWVADNRSWPGLSPAFSSSAQTVHGSSADTNVPTLHWEGGAWSDLRKLAPAAARFRHRTTARSSRWTCRRAYSRASG